jgi:glycerol-3-phosphate dehydrogenase
VSADEADILVIGGGINGCGIAADASGRALKVVLAEMSDLASGTSSASSKLIHGGLRYLEHGEVRLVREALAEREVLLSKAPHIVWPLRFVLPNGPGSRHPWLIRAGLLFYDNLARRKTIPGSRAVDLRRDPAGRPLKAGLDRGFAYWDCWVDDARLVVLNARAAADQGARILTRARVQSVAADGRHWRAVVETPDGLVTVRAKAVVNAAGPWAGQTGAAIVAPHLPSPPVLRLIKGSHIVVPRIPGADDAYLLQAGDGRVVFALPFEEQFTIIGTTDVPFSGDPARVGIDRAEETYLLELASRYFRRSIGERDVVWRYSGVRPLYDDQSDNPSAVTRDYRLELMATDNLPPLLTVLGGKVTTYRRLAEEAVDRLAPFLPGTGRAWTASVPLPGGDMPGADFEAFLSVLVRERPGFGPDFLKRLARRHGTAVSVVLGPAKGMSDLGADLGHGLTEREVAYMGEREWARTAEDVLWRRSKIGLHLDEAARETAARAIERILG